MTGRGHLISGAAVLMDFAAFSALAYSRQAHPALQSAGRFLLSHLSPWHAMGGGIAGLAGCAAALAFYVTGLLLPDIDNDGSTACKITHLRLPFYHRGWTHSVWALLPALLLSAKYMPFLWLFTGMLLHDFMDGLSQAGWAVFYPFGQWRIQRGIVMRRGWTPGLYSSARPGSEEAVCGIIVIACLLLAALGAYLGFWPGGKGIGSL